MRETPKALTTTLIWKHLRGTRLIAEPNGNKVKDVYGQSAGLLPNLV